MKIAEILSLISILTLTMSFVIACGDDDDDDNDDADADDDNDDDDSDDDQNEDDCYDQAHDAGQLYCEDYGLNALSGGGLDYSYAECDIYCSGEEVYYTDACEVSYCVCCG